MKNLIVVFTLVLFVVQGHATNDYHKIPKEELRNEIISLLDKRPNINIAEEYIEARIVFTVNAKNQIVVLTIDAKEGHTEIKNYIKSRLNYKKVKFDTTHTSSEKYEMNLKILRPKA